MHNDCLGRQTSFWVFPLPPSLPQLLLLSMASYGMKYPLDSHWWVVWEEEKALTLCKYCSAIIKMFLCCQHCFSTNQKHGPTKARIKNWTLFQTKSVHCEARFYSDYSKFKHLYTNDHQICFSPYFSFSMKTIAFQYSLMRFPWKYWILKVRGSSDTVIWRHTLASFKVLIWRWLLWNYVKKILQIHCEEDYRPIVMGFFNDVVR